MAWNLYSSEGTNHCIRQIETNPSTRPHHTDTSPSANADVFQSKAQTTQQNTPSISSHGVVNTVPFAGPPRTRHTDNTQRRHTYTAFVLELQTYLDCKQRESRVHSPSSFPGCWDLYRLWFIPRYRLPLVRIIYFCLKRTSNPVQKSATAFD